MSEPTSEATPPRDANPLRLPRVVFGSSALGNLFEAPSAEQKLAITKAWMEAAPDEGEGKRSQVAIDSAGKYGAGLALECIGANLRQLDVDPEGVLISNKLGWFRTPLTTPEPTFEPGAWVDLEHDAEQRISRQGILDCWQQGCQLLGDLYRPQLVSVHDPDEFLAAARDEEDRQRRVNDLLEAYESLIQLKEEGQVQAIGVGAKDWQAAKFVADRVDLDWVMIANSLTVYTHPPALLAWIDELSARGVAVINSAVFNAGFLVGGKYFDYRLPSPDSPSDQKLFDWRNRFMELCQRRQVKPAAACVEFALSSPGVTAVALNTSHPERVAECVRLGEAKCPPAFWAEAKQLGLVAANYPHLAI